MAAVRNDETGHRYVLDTPAGPALALYAREDDMVVFTHTEVPEELEGQGIGSALVKGALADARARGWRIQARCAFVKAYLERHPDEGDLPAQDA